MHPDPLWVVLGSAGLFLLIYLILHLTGHA